MIPSLLLTTWCTCSSMTLPMAASREKWRKKVASLLSMDITFRSSASVTPRTFHGELLELNMLLNPLVFSPLWTRPRLTLMEEQRKLSSLPHLLMPPCLLLESTLKHMILPWRLFPMLLAPPTAWLLWLKLSMTTLVSLKAWWPLSMPSLQPRKPSMDLLER